MARRSWRLLAVPIPVLLAAFVAAASDAPNSNRAADIEAGRRIVSTQKLKMHLTFIASDELEGRGTPSRGLDLAARYIASHLEYYGYQPAGDEGSYYQRISMSRRKPSKESLVRVQAGDKSAEFRLGTDFLGSGSTATGKLVFAGYGAVSKEAGYDDYEGLDVKDKLVVVFDGYPKGTNPEAFKAERKFGNRTVKVGLSKFLIARERGAVGSITIKAPEHSASKDGKPSPFQQGLPALERESTVFDFHDTAQPTNVELTAEAAGRLQEALGIDLVAIRAKIDETQKPQPTPIDASFETAFKHDVLEKIYTQNVLGFLEGSDPVLKDEIIAFSAHYDHLHPLPAPAPGQASSGDAKPKDRIYNGADDDGSGTVGILTLAEAFAAVQRPRRSLLFIWHAGEERGLIGSDYYVKHPTKPLAKIASLINIDMIGRNFSDKPENADHVYLVGAARTSSDLRELIVKTTGDRLRLDETDARNYFGRSDHFNYARNRVPVAFFCTGEHKDYHQLSDEVHAILFDKMKRILDVVFECGLELANRDTRPAFTGQGF
jgi:hypothetical protein